MDRKLLRTAIRNLLADTGTVWTDTVLNQAIDEVTGDFSRVTPNQKIFESTLDYIVTAEAFTVNHSTARALANKPIEYASETVTVSSTDYVRDTDYTMDYANGTITVLSSGNITDGASATIDYNKSRLSVDLGALTDMISPWQVEHPVGSTPQDIAAYEIFNGILWLTSSGGVTQSAQADKSHVRVYYAADHTAPTDTTSGSHARFLDRVMIKGAVSYSLFIRYRSLILKSDKDTDAANAILGSVSKALGRIDTALDAATATNGPHTQLGIAIGRVGTSLLAADGVLSGVRQYTDDANTALDKVETHLGAGSNSADTALKKIASIVTDIGTALTKVTTHLTGSTSSAKAALDAILVIQGNVATTLAGVDTFTSDAKISLNKVQTQLDQAVSILGGVGLRDSLGTAALTNVNTYLTGATDSAKAAVEDILDKNVFADADAALNMIESNIDVLQKAEAVWEGDVVGDTAAIPGQVDHIEGSDGAGSGTGVDSAAQDYLETGDGLINTVNLGQRAAALNAEYAMVEIELSRVYADRRKDFLAEGDRVVAQSQIYLNEALARQAQAHVLIAEGAEWSRVAQTFISEAGSHHQGSQTLVAAADQHHQNAAVLVDESTQRIAQASTVVNTAVQQLGSIQALVNEAAQWANMADGFVREAIERNQVIRGHLEEAAQRTSIAGGYTAEALQRVNLAGALMTEAQRHVDIARTSIDESSSWANEVQLYINEAGTWIAEIEAIDRSAEMYLGTAIRRMEIADRVREDAENRHQEYWDMLQSRVHTARQTSSSSKRQWSSGGNKFPDVPTGD